MQLPRFEDTVRERIVWPELAEISLCGALGCGRAIVEHALADLRCAGFKAVVLQSTLLAVPFYERLGFVRIGAVSRYHDRKDLPEVAHRHWTDRIEEVCPRDPHKSHTVTLNWRTLQDDASYMMALPLSAELVTASSGFEVAPASVISRALRGLRDSLSGASDKQVGASTPHKVCRRIGSPILPSRRLLFPLVLFRKYLRASKKMPRYLLGRALRK
jgi:hypothetical protein